MKQEIKDVIFLHFIVLIWGFTAIIGLLINRTPIEIVFYRTGISTFLLAIIIFSMKRSLVLSSRRSLLKTVIVGFFVGNPLDTFFLISKNINCSGLLGGHGYNLFWVSIIEPLFFKKQIKLFEVFLSLLALSGILIVFSMEVQYFKGLSLSILAAILAAFFSIINVSLVKKEDHFVITFF